MNIFLALGVTFSLERLPDKVESNFYLSSLLLIIKRQIAKLKGTYLKDMLLNIRSKLSKLVILIDEIKRKSIVKILTFLISSRSFEISNSNFLCSIFHSLFTQNNFKMNLGFLIKRIRISKGLRQSDIVDKTKLSKSYISEIENGIKTPRLEQLELISKSLDVPLSVLFFLAIDKKDIKTGDKEKIVKELGVIMKNVTELFELNIEEERRGIGNKLEVSNNIVII